MLVPHVGSRADFMRSLLDGDDGGGTGGGAPDGGKPDGGNEGGKPDDGNALKIEDLVKTEALREFLKKQGEEVGAMIAAEIGGLKSALDKEKENSKEADERARTNAEKDLREKIAAEERVKLATENAKKARDEGEDEDRIKVLEEELAKRQAALDRHSELDSFRSDIKAQNLGALEEVLTTIRFGGPDEIKKALEKLGVIRADDITAGISKGLPNSKPPGGGDKPPNELKPQLEYAK